MRHFATYFDGNYLVRALALFESLDAHCAPWDATVLCMDEAAELGLKALGRSNLKTLRLDELEAAEPALAAVKPSRSRIEYYFSCGPAFLERTLLQLPENEPLVYLDADLYFFSAPDALEKELEGQSVGIVEHNFSPRNAPSLAAGRFNVGWIYFRNDPNGRAVLKWWKERCIEWCFDRVEGERYADQKYLDQWPALFKGVHVIRHRGANVAPWNADHFNFQEPLLFYHFHGLKQPRAWLFDLNVGAYGAKCWGRLRREAYLPYLRVLDRVGKGAQLSGIRAPMPSLGLRSLKRALINGSFALKLGNSFW